MCAREKNFFLKNINTIMIVYNNNYKNLIDYL